MAKQKYFTLGTYSISLLHYSLYHWDKRELVFLRPIKVFRNLSAEYYGYKIDEDRMYRIWWNRITKDPGYMVKYGKDHKRHYQNLNIYLNKILPKIDKLNKKDLHKIFKKYWKLLFLSQPIGDINLVVDEIYIHKVNKPLQELMKSQGKEKKFTEYLVALTTPWEMLITQKEEIDFLKFVRQVKKGTVDDLNELLNKHLIKYQSIPCWYDNPAWQLVDLQKRLNTELKAKDITKRLNHLQTFQNKLKNKSKKIQKDLKLSGKLLKDIKGLRYFTFIRTQIDLETGFIVHKAKPIYEKICDSIGLSLADIKFLTPKEIRQALVGKVSTTKLKKKIKPRKVLAVQIFRKDKQRILTGKKAISLVKKIKKELDNKSEIKVDTKNKSLEGLGASPGKARGKARIITSVKDLPKMREGEILIVPATSVDFVAAIKKSAAVVTEHGGVTCHAAIVSRELNKPCLVNTIVATRQFKNGDLLEVDADQGQITKLS